MAVTAPLFLATIARRILTIIMGTVLGGCASVNLPLCPRIGLLSHSSGESAANYVNSYVISAAQKRDIRITVLGPFVAEFRGSWHDVEWIEQNYPAMLCAFDPSRVIDPTPIHTVCAKHAASWISIVKDNRLDDLFLEEHLFKAICYPQLGGS